MTLPPIPRVSLARLYRDLRWMQDHAARTPLFADEVRWESPVRAGTRVRMPA